ncbi:MAG TPA: substrate-binding domain-containing protein, partial [Aggregatilineales bacterium]|nr:substrate-binding domain-containing protein [Aggregatilineales bacterium]
NISVFLGISNNDPDQEMAIIETFHQRRVDGILVAAAQISAQYAKRLKRINVPTVLINQQAETPFEMLHTVSVDDYGGARQAVSHLLDLGHRSIGYLGAGNRPRSNRLRLEAYCETLTGAGIQVRDGWVKTAPPDHRFHSEDVTDGTLLLPSLLDQGISAVFCYNDMIAVGALLACRELGILVPAQLSIVGFDDIELAQYVTPPLTTIYQPKMTLGQVAMEMLLDLMANRPVEDKVLPTELVRRLSTELVHPERANSLRVVSSG